MKWKIIYYTILIQACIKNRMKDYTEYFLKKFRKKNISHKIFYIVKYIIKIVWNYFTLGKLRSLRYTHRDVPRKKYKRDCKLERLRTREIVNFDTHLRYVIGGRKIYLLKHKTSFTTRIINNKKRRFIYWSTKPLYDKHNKIIRNEDLFTE